MGSGSLGVVTSFCDISGKTAEEFKTLLDPDSPIVRVKDQLYKRKE